MPSQNSLPFPRGVTTPLGDLNKWVSQKDQHIRQLLIQDIESTTGRRLIVYFTNCDGTDALIDASDDVYLKALLDDCGGVDFDLLLETNGGMTDATEKLCSMLRSIGNSYRVIVPRRAKSNGTVIAISGNIIVMGYASELGPIDPSIGGIPVEFIINDTTGTFNTIDIQTAQTARSQTRKLAKEMLSTGMMAGFTDQELEETIDKIATRNHFHSHGSVMNATEAKSLNLKVEFLQSQDDLWRKIWLLRSLYQTDCESNGYSKIFESSNVNSTLKQT